MKRCLGCMEEYDGRARECPFCGFDETEEQDREFLTPGSLLKKRYLVGRAMCRRETDLIYIGWDRLFQRKVTIQEFFPEYCVTRSETAAVSLYSSRTREELFEQGMERFVSAGENLIRLYREPDIAETYSCFQENNTAYLITAYWDLPTIWEIRQERRISRREAKRMFGGAVSTMKKLHRRGIYHCSLDEDSFWVREDGGLILREPEPARCVCGRLDGLDYGNPGCWTDVYGLAALFGQIFAGRLRAGDSPGMGAGWWRLRKSERTALRNALQENVYYRTKTMEELEWEYLGQKRIRGLKRERAKDGPLPGWIRWGGALTAAAVVGAAVLIGTGAWPAGPRFSVQQASGRVNVPNLLNEDEETARRICRESGLFLRVEAVREPEEGIPSGVVLFQEPSPQERKTVQRGSEIRVTLSGGKETPGAGSAPEEGMDRIEERGLERE